MSSTSVESRSSVRDLPQIVAEMETELMEEIRALDAQLTTSRQARLGGDAAAIEDANNTIESVGPDDFDAESVALLEEVLLLLDQAVTQYNDAIATQVEGAAVALDEARKALKDGQSELEQRKTEEKAAKTPPTESPSPQRPVSNAKSEVSSSSTTNPPPTESHTVSPAPANDAAPPAMFKAGMLLNLGKERFMRSFSNHYVVVSDGQTPGSIDGIAWYDSEAAFLKKSKPIDSIPFYTVTQNSRGSRFKKASVCWPHLTHEDCPKITSVKVEKAFFAVDNVTAPKNELIVFAAGTKKEREEWVYFITKFVALYLPPGDEFEAYANTPVGATKPLHVSHVLDGEAPGSAQRVV